LPACPPHGNGGLLQFGPGAADDGDIRAEPGEADGDGPAQPAPAAGDDGFAIGEVEKFWWHE
jgi:hypothetical protein